MLGAFDGFALFPPWDANELSKGMVTALDSWNPRGVLPGGGSKLARELGIGHSATFYKWRAKCGGMDVSMMARMKELEGIGPGLARSRSAVPTSQHHAMR